MRLVILLALVQMVLIQKSVLAAIVVDFGPAVTLAPNSTSSVDVFIRSDIGDIDLAFAEYEFTISLTSANPSGVVRFLPSFDSVATPRQNDDEKSADTYVFFNGPASDNFTAVRQLAPFENVLNGGDSTFDLNTFTFSNVTLGAVPKLLTRLEIEQFQAGQGGSGTFQIALTAGKFQNADQANVFDDSLGSLTFATTNGTIQVSASAVPESSSALLCGMGCLYVILRQRRRGLLIAMAFGPFCLNSSRCGVRGYSALYGLLLNRIV